VEVPEPIRRAVAAADDRHPSCVDRAVELALRRITELPDYESYVAGLVHNAVRELVHARRGQRNTAMRREQGEYGRPAKVNPLLSAAVSGAYESVYLYRLGGAVLGDLTGEALEQVARSEEEGARTKLFNARLARWCLAQGVAEGRRVRDVIPEKKLAAAFRRLLPEGQAAAAA